MNHEEEPRDLGPQPGPPKRFETFFEGPYIEFRSVLARVVADNQSILDIGSNNGNSEMIIDQTAKGCSVICDDVNEKALAELRAKEFKQTTVKTVNQDANEFLALAPTNQDLVIVNATLHEINDPKDQEGYLDFFFNRLKKILKPGGKVVMGDYYYPEEVSDEEVRAFMAYQLAEINHADPREKFVPPDLFKRKLAEHGFNTDYENEMPAVEGIDRRYHLFVASLKTEEK